MAVVIRGSFDEGPVKLLYSDTSQSIGIILNQTFTGVIRFDNIITHYSPYTVDTNIVVTPSSNRITCGSAIIRMIGDGTSVPVFTAFKKIESSLDYDETINTVNLVTFLYDGVDLWYCIDREAS